MTDRISLLRPDGSAGGLVPVSEMGLLASPTIETVVVTALTLSDSYHGKILDFTNGSAVAVTIPSGLRADFICGISQGGAGQVTVGAGGGVTLNEASSQFATSAQYVLLTLVAFSLDAFRLYGATA